MTKWEYLNLRVANDDLSVHYEQNAALPEEVHKSLFERGSGLVFIYIDAALRKMGELNWELSGSAQFNSGFTVLIFKRPVITEEEKDPTLYYLLTDVFATHPNPTSEYRLWLAKLHTEGLLDDEQFTNLMKLLDIGLKPKGPNSVNP